MQIDLYKAYFAGFTMVVTGIGIGIISGIAICILGVGVSIPHRQNLLIVSASILGSSILLNVAGIWTCKIVEQIWERQARQSIQPNGS